MGQMPIWCDWLQHVERLLSAGAYVEYRVEFDRPTPASKGTVVLIEEHITRSSKKDNPRGLSFATE